MINVLVFSKDRACQLDLLLESIADHMGGFCVTHVLYTATNDNYERGYEKLKGHRAGVLFHREEVGIDFKSQVLGIVDAFDFDFSICFCDDDVVVRLVDLDDALLLLTPEINALSLRMAPDITYCYAKNFVMNLPDFTTPKEGVLEWNWSQSRPDVDWGYPLSLAGNVYRTNFIKNYWPDLPFDSPNMIEGLMNTSFRTIIKRKQRCFTEQRVYNVANNLVQTVCPNRYHENKANHPQVLNSKFLEGYKINKYKLYGVSFGMANGPAIYEMIK